MTIPALNAFNKIYPLIIDKYETFIPNVEDEDIVVKINSVITHLNSVGKLSNDVVAQWNKVMKWILENGLDESVTKKLDEMVASGAIREIIDTALAEMATEVDTRLDGFESSLTEIATNVKKFGAKGDGVTDDAQAIRDAIAYAKSNGYQKVILPPGTYRVNSTIKVSTENEKLGVMLEGTDAESVTILSGVTGTTPLFTFEKTLNNPDGWNERWSNAGMRNIRMNTVTDSNGVAVYLRGCVFNQFENIRINNFKYGLHLHNEGGAGVYTEANIFRNCRVDFCDNAIRMEQGTGDASFHGNVFDKVYMNVLPNQIGFNFLSGYYYNGRIDLFMWMQKNSDGTHPTGSARPTIMNVVGTARNILGNITIEAYTTGQLTGTGTMYMRGHIHGIMAGDVTKVYDDVTGHRADSSYVYHFDNQFIAKKTKDLSANAGVTQGSTFLGYANPNRPFFASVRVYGTNFEYRKFMVCWFNGTVGQNGIFQDLGVFQDTPKAGVTVTSRWVGDDGKFGINIQTDIPLTIEYSAFAFNHGSDNLMAYMS